MQWIQNDLPGFLSIYGCWAVAALLILESIGLPIPGATVLVTAAIYAGVTQSLDIEGIIAAASLGAVIGDNMAYWLGRTTGLGLLHRYGRYAGLTESRLEVGAYLFQRHGGKLVILARFVAFLRVLTMYVAGISRMEWPRFVLFDLAGSVAWALVFGFGAYQLGQQAQRLTGSVSLVLLLLAAASIAAAVLLAKRHMERLSAEAETALAERHQDADPHSPSG